MERPTPSPAPVVARFNRYRVVRGGGTLSSAVGGLSGNGAVTINATAIGGNGGAADIAAGISAGQGSVAQLGQVSGQSGTGAVSVSGTAIGGNGGNGVSILSSTFNPGRLPMRYCSRRPNSSFTIWRISSSSARWLKLTACNFTLSNRSSSFARICAALPGNICS